MAPAPQPFDLSKPPFRVREGADARTVAEDIIACLQLVSGLPQKMTQCFHAAARVAGLPEDDPLCVAGERIARDVDAGVGAGGDNAYHNAQHFCEVLLSALYLSLLARLAPREQTQLLLAALLHDFHHDGTSNANVPFRLERMAAEAAAPYLEAVGVPPEERARIAAMVFATEVELGTRFARDCHLHFAGTGPRPSLSGVPEPLAALAGDARLALQAVILGEADVLSSAGLTVQYGELQQERLAEEWKRPLGAEHKLHFFNQIFQEFTVGRFFSPNLRELKEAAQDRVGKNRGPARPK